MAAGDRLKLRAEAAEDLPVIAAALQSAILLTADMSYQPRERRVAAMFNRFRWEADEGSEKAAGGQRIRAALRIDFVDKVSASGFRPGADGGILELLTIASEPREAPAAEVTLVFAGGAKLRLAVDSIDCTLDDVGEPWETPNRPDHGLDAEREEAS